MRTQSKLNKENVVYNNRLHEVYDNLSCLTRTHIGSSFKPQTANTE